MTYESKYYSLERGGGEGWTNADFAWAVEKLETMSQEKLVAICKLPEITLRFTGENWETETDDEQIISAILADYDADLVMKILRNLP